MCHSRNINNQKIKLYECALRLVSNVKSSSFLELFEKDKSVTIHERIIQVLLTVIFKVKSEVRSKIMADSFKLKDHSCDLRKNNCREKQIKLIC